MIGFLVYGLIIICTLLVIEFISRKLSISKELTRKAAHILIGLTTASMPLFIPFIAIQLLATTFILILLLSRKYRLLNSIHEVNRSTLGEIYFPLSVFVLATFFQESSEFIFGMLVLTLSDGFSGLLGKRINKYPYVLFGAHKTLAGSFIFFLITYFLSSFFIFGIGSVSSSILLSSLISAVLTFAEASLSKGLDNLVLPVLAASLLSVIN